MTSTINDGPCRRRIAVPDLSLNRIPYTPSIIAGFFRGEAEHDSPTTVARMCTLCTEGAYGSPGDYKMLSEP